MKKKKKKKKTIGFGLWTRKFIGAAYVCVCARACIEGARVRLLPVIRRTYVCVRYLFRCRARNAEEYTSKEETNERKRRSIALQVLYGSTN